MLRLSLLLIAALIFSKESNAETLVMNLRSNSKAAQDYCKNKKECREVDSKVKEFGNDNTFVQFADIVTNHSFHLIVPKKLSSNDLMEALIKVRTANDQNPNDIGVIFESGASALAEELLDAHFSADQLVDYFYVAGAKWIQIGGHRLALPLTNAQQVKFLLQKSVAQSVVVDAGHKQLADNIGKNLNLPVWSLAKLKKYLATKNDKGLQVFMVAPVSIPVNDNLFKTLQDVYELKAHGHKVALITPYFPYARSDKKDQPGVTVTGRLVADLIELSGADMSSFVRLHAPQAQGFFHIPTVHISGRETIDNFLKEYKVDAIISPDAGFQKDATMYADDLGLPVYVINKQRDPITGVSELREMGELNIKGLRLAIIDDETASGSTLGAAAEFLKSKGAASVIGVVTHLAGKAEKALENRALDLVVVTDTFPVSVTQTERFKVLSVGEEIAKNLAPHVIQKKCDFILTQSENR